MYDLDSVHQVAADFLKELSNGNTEYAEEKLEVTNLEVTSLVVLKQAGTPPFFYGFKPSGRPVFTHDQKIAKSFSTGAPELGQHVEKLRLLGHEVEEHMDIWREERDAVQAVNRLVRMRRAGKSA